MTRTVTALYDNLPEARYALQRLSANVALTGSEIVDAEAEGRGGLLQERVIEIAEMREEAIVSKEACVREELVVKKTIERRVEQVQETVRRTQVEMGELDRPETRSAFPAINRNENGTPVIGGSSPAV
jgi:hypothetical protein